MGLEAKIRAVNEHFLEVLDHLGVLRTGFVGTPSPGEDGTRYTKPDPNFPRGGTDPIDIGDPYDPTGKNQPKTPGDGKGLPPDGTGTGSLPNTGLPSDGSSAGLDSSGFGGGEGA